MFSEYVKKIILRKRKYEWIQVRHFRHNQKRPTITILLATWGQQKLPAVNTKLILCYHFPSSYGEHVNTAPYPAYVEQH